MINIFRSIALSLLGMLTVGWVSIVLIILMITNQGDWWLTNFIANNLVMSERLESLGRTFGDVASGMLNLMVIMNIIFLCITTLFSIGWSAGSHYLNIDAPGKAKIYFIHWIITTSAFVGIIVFGSIFFLNSTNFDNDFVSSGGVWFLTILSGIYYFIVYYLGVLLGTARFARSSVLFANKLPGVF